MSAASYTHGTVFRHVAGIDTSVSVDGELSASSGVVPPTARPYNYYYVHIIDKLMVSSNWGGCHSRSGQSLPSWGCLVEEGFSPGCFVRVSCASRLSLPFHLTNCVGKKHDASYKIIVPPFYMSTRRCCQFC